MLVDEAQMVQGREQLNPCSPGQTFPNASRLVQQDSCSIHWWSTRGDEPKLSPGRCMLQLLQRLNSRAPDFGASHLVC